ncbi:hypothetical protein HPB50_027488 [Hyalomma asiaticum]|uniref:Uncharacterized protein n=1 Tax=Hyalomma asiaticum TaxID=266040 RepID=A0ACB7T7B1_HYAAI|nr:hypothetical protein HPB50_027488 [Hyalomma asiaticum]
MDTGEPDVAMPDKKAAVRRVDWLHFLRSLHLELFLFVYAVSYSMRLVMTQDLLLTKACLQRYSINATACRNLSWNTTIKDDVTRYANVHNLALFLIQFVPAGLLSIFVSPWSDRYGHKIPLLVATSGGILQDLTTLFTVMAVSAPLGGLVSVCASVYSNGTRTASAELKTVRFAFIMTALTLGFQLGLFVGGQVFRAAGGNYTAIYVTSAVLLAVMFVWIGWTVPFSSQLHRTSRRELVRDLMRLDNLREGGRAVFRLRPGYNRAKLLLLMISIWFILFNSETARNINYFYTETRFDWSPVKFSNVTAFFGLVQLLATAVCVVVLSRLMQVRDLVLACLGVVAFALQNALKGISTHEWMYYLTKVFSFWTTCESLVPAFGDIFSSLVFNAALSYQPGLPFLIGAALQLFPLAALILCLRMPHADPEDDDETMLEPDRAGSTNQLPHTL